MIAPIWYRLLGFACALLGGIMFGVIVWQVALSVAILSAGVLALENGWKTRRILELETKQE